MSFATRIVRKGLVILALWASALGAVAGPAHAVSVTDDSGAVVRLAAPARRVLALSPHATELIYAAGGGAALAGAVAFSNYPPAARQLPRVGDSRALDLERIVALKPDLAVVWWHGTPPRQIDQLRALGIPVFLSEPRNFEQIASTIERFGTLFDTASTAAPAAAAFRHSIGALRERYAKRAPVTVFYQVWDTPLMTINHDSIINEAIDLCGGRNVFATLPALTPTLSTEAVLEANPAAIVTAVSPGSKADADLQREPAGPEAAVAAVPTSLRRWLAWPKLRAAATGNLFGLNADWITRAGPRMALGAQQLCTRLQTARERLALSR